MTFLCQTSGPNGGCQSSVDAKAQRILLLLPSCGPGIEQQWSPFTIYFWIMIWKGQKQRKKEAQIRP